MQATSAVTSLPAAISAWIARYDPSNLIYQQLPRLEVTDGDHSILLRANTNDYPGNCFAICTVKLAEHAQSKGWFKAFLTYCCTVSPWPTIIIEDVENERLRQFCERLNFSVVSIKYPTSYIVNQDTVLELGVQPLR